MATFTKTVVSDSITLQSVAEFGVVVGTAIDVSNKIGGIVNIRFGRRDFYSADAGVVFRVEISSKTSGDNSWFPIAMFTTGYSTNVTIQTINGEVEVGQTHITTYGGGFSIGEIVYFDFDNSPHDVSDSFWARVKADNYYDFDVEESIPVALDSHINVSAKAEIFPSVEIPIGALRVRVVADGSNFKKPYACQAQVITIDSI